MGICSDLLFVNSLFVELHMFCTDCMRLFRFDILILVIIVMKVILYIIFFDYDLRGFVILLILRNTYVC